MAGTDQLNLINPRGLSFFVDTPFVPAPLWISTNSLPQLVLPNLHEEPEPETLFTYKKICGKNYLNSL